MNKPLHIVMVTGDFYPDSTGGVQRVVYHLARGLVERGRRVTVLTRRLSREMPREEEIEGIRVVRFESKTSGLARFHLSEFTSSRRALRRIMQRESVDLVHIHEPLPGLGAVSAMAGTGVPSVYTFHGQWSVQWLDARTYGSRGGGAAANLFAKYLRAIERLAMRRSRRLVALSRFMARTAVDLYSIAPQRLRIVPNGVDLEHFAPMDRRAARGRFDLPEDRFVLGFAGRLSGEKGVSILLRAVSQLRKQLSDAMLVVAGAGPEREALERDADRLGIRDRVRFLGHVMDMPAFYGALDLLVVPSIREPFGLVTLESLACGTPVISGPVGGTAEALGELDRRLIFPNVTPEAMAQTIGECAESASREARRRCREFVEQRFSWGRMVDAYERVYAECLDL